MNHDLKSTYVRDTTLDGEYVYYEMKEWESNLAFNIGLYAVPLILIYLLIFGL